MTTNESEHDVYIKNLNGASTLIFGGANCNVPDTNNYFILIGKVMYSESENIFHAPFSSSVHLKADSYGPNSSFELDESAQPVWQLRRHCTLSNCFIEFLYFTRI